MKIKINKSTYNTWFITPTVFFIKWDKYKEYPDMIFRSFAFAWLKWGVVLHFIKTK